MQRRPELLLRQLLQQSSHAPAQPCRVPGIIGWIAGAAAELKHQPPQGSATEIKIHTCADAHVLAEGKGQPAAHGIGADQHLLGLEGIARDRAAELCGQSSGQLLDAVAADQAKHRLSAGSL